MNALEIVTQRIERKIDGLKRKMKNPYYRGINFKALHAIEHEVEIITEKAYFTDESYYEAIAKLEGIETVLSILNE